MKYEDRFRDFWFEDVKRIDDSGLFSDDDVVSEDSWNWSLEDAEVVSWIIVVVCLQSSFIISRLTSVSAVSENQPK